jgi:hypothetical protein
MTPQLLVKRFQKYGGMVILFNGIIFSIIFAVSFPLLSDKRLLYSFIILFLISFSGIFTYYMITIKGIIRLINIGDNDSKLKIRKTFDKAARLTMYANIIYLLMIYLPLFFLMYFKFGYTNLYYHFYVFSVSILLFLFLGFNSMLI